MKLKCQSPNDKPSPNDKIQIANKVQMPKSKCQIKPKCLNVKRKGGINTAPAAALFWVCSQVLRNLTCEIWFVKVAHEFQAEINMNSLFEQGENVASCQGLGARNWGVGARDWRLEAAGMVLRNGHPSQ